MAGLIATVTSRSARAPLARLLTAPLGLDVWEVRPDHLVVQADEAQAARLEAMGYGVEQVQLLEPYLSTFATDDAAAGSVACRSAGACFSACSISWSPE